MRQNADLDVKTVNEPIKKFGREQNAKWWKNKRKKNRHAKLGSYVEKMLGSDTTAENFFKKARSWVKRQEILQRQIQRKIDEEFLPVPEMRNPLSKYAFDDGEFY